MPIVKLAAGRDRSVALTEIGQAWAWGALRTWDATAPEIPESLMGNICSSDPALVGHKRYAQPRALLLNSSTPFALVAESHTRTLAVCSDGHTWACQPVVDLEKGSVRQRLNGIPSTAITQLAATASAGLALDDKGSVWSWGPNTQGQLGRKGDVWHADVGQVLGVHTIRQLAAGSAHVLALDTDGTIWT